jgi:hypothetical protein
MATNFNSATHNTVRSRIVSETGRKVFDHVPHQPEGKPDEDFPFVAMGDSDFIPFDNDDTKGAQVDVNVHVLSRYKGDKEARDILDEVYAALHRAALTRTGYNFVDCFFEFSGVITLDDGNTRLGTARYRVTIQEA